MDTRRIRRGLERPLPFMFLEPTEWLVLLVGLGGGIILRKLSLGFVLAFAALYIYRKMKAKGKRGYWTHRLYRVGIPADPLLAQNAPKATAVDYCE